MRWTGNASSIEVGIADALYSLALGSSIVDTGSNSFFCQLRLKTLIAVNIYCFHSEFGVVLVNKDSLLTIVGNKVKSLTARPVSVTVGKSIRNIGYIVFDINKAKSGRCTVRRQDRYYSIYYPG